MSATDDVFDMAVPYALHALTDAEREEIDTHVRRSGDAERFYHEVGSVRESMAAVSAVTAVRPPAGLRNRVLAGTSSSATRSRRRPALWAAAAAAAIAIGAVGLGIWMRPEPSTAQQVFAATDVRTVGASLPAGGTAMLVFSHDRDAGLLVMNNVPPPQPGTVYQMWLLRSGGPTSAGTMDTAAVAPSTTAVLPDLGDSTALAFTVEPGAGSAQPTGEIFAKLPLV